MTKALAQTYNRANEYRAQISYALLAGCTLLIFMYAFNLYTVIAKTVAMQKVEAQSAALTSQVEALDSQYLALTSKITPDSLSQYGMSQGTVTAYIPRSASFGRVAMGGHEL